MDSSSLLPRDGHTDSPHKATKMFSMRIVSLDYYMSPPNPSMDVCYSAFQGRPVTGVPVVRLYGPTPSGQKTCLHLHGSFPYLYVPYDADLPQNLNEALVFVRHLASAIEKGMKLASNIGAKQQHVHSCSLVRAKKFYGFHPSEQLFIKIVLYHPQEVSRLSALLLGGGILNRSFQPHESHIPYLLQFLIDYNLAGMGYIHLSNLKFRQPLPDYPFDRKCITRHNIRTLALELTKNMATGDCHDQEHDRERILSDSMHFKLQQRFMEAYLGVNSPTAIISPVVGSQSNFWLRKTIPEDWTWSILASDIAEVSQGQGALLLSKHSTCELEADASVKSILNWQEKLHIPLKQVGPEIKMVQSLVPIWEEELAREAFGLDLKNEEEKLSVERKLENSMHAQEHFKVLDEILHKWFKDKNDSALEIGHNTRMCPDQNPSERNCFSPWSSEKFISSGSFVGKDHLQDINTEMEQNNISLSTHVNIEAGADSFLKETQPAHSQDSSAGGESDDICVLRACLGRHNNTQANHNTGIADALNVQDLLIDSVLQENGSSDDLVNEEIVKIQLTQNTQEAEEEAIELLRWMVCSQHKDDDCESDNEEVVDKTSWSQNFHSADMALARAISYYENASQQECEAILDCIDECGKLACEEVKRQEIISEKNQVGVQSLLKSTVLIPQCDGASDELLDRFEQEQPEKAEGCHSGGIECETSKREIINTLHVPSNVAVASCAVSCYTSLKQTSESKPLWGPLPLVAGEESSLRGGGIRENVVVGACEVSRQLELKHADTFQQPNEGRKDGIEFRSGKESGHSLRDLMRRKWKRKPANEIVSSDTLSSAPPSDMHGSASFHGQREHLVSTLKRADRELPYNVDETVSADSQQSKKLHLQSDFISNFTELHLRHKSTPLNMLGTTAEISSKYGSLSIVKAEINNVGHESEPETNAEFSSNGYGMLTASSAQAAKELITANGMSRKEKKFDMFTMGQDCGFDIGEGTACDLTNLSHGILNRAGSLPSTCINMATENFQLEIRKDIMPSNSQNISAQCDEVEPEKLSHPDVPQTKAVFNVQSRTLPKEKVISEYPCEAPAYRGVIGSQECSPEVRGHFQFLTQEDASQSKADMPKAMLLNKGVMVPLVFCKKPPTADQIYATFHKYNLFPAEHGDAFFGNPEDIPEQPVVMAGLVFEANSKEVAYLREYTFGMENEEATAGASNQNREYALKEVWKPLQKDNPMIGVPLHFLNDGTALFPLTPLRAPPLPTAVLQWVCKNKLVNVGTFGRHCCQVAPAFNQDTNSGKLIPVADSPVDTEGSWREDGQFHSDGQLFQPASPKYDENCILTCSSLDHFKSPSRTMHGQHIGFPFLREGKCLFGATKSDHLWPHNAVQLLSDEELPSTSSTKGQTLEFSLVSTTQGDCLPSMPVVGLKNQGSPPTASPAAQALLPMQCGSDNLPTAHACPLSHKYHIHKLFEVHKFSRSDAQKVTFKAAQPDERDTRVIKDWQDVSQITASTSAGIRDTPLSQSGFRDPASTGLGQQLMMMSVEVFGETRGDLLPDPRYDGIGCIVIVLKNDDSHMNDATQTIVLLKDPKFEVGYRTRDGLADCEVVALKDEATLLWMFIFLVRLYDPDILVGWEIQGFSFGLLAERSANLGIGLLKQISRTPPVMRRVVEAMLDIDNIEQNSEGIFSHRMGSATEPKIDGEWGRIHGSEIYVGGRVVLNLWRIIRSEIKLGIYTLEAVAEAVLKRKVPHIPWCALTQWFSSGPGRLRFHCIAYFVERAKLNLQIMDQLDLLNRTSELARVFGIDFFSVLSRGSQYRVESMLCRLAHTQNFLLISPSRQQVAAQPAMECLPLVMEPESRFYTDPVVVLDFQSLYPSMIIAYNLCFSTCLGKLVSANPKVLGVSSLVLKPELLMELKDKLTFTRNGVMYVPSEISPGILPRLLQEILSTRILVKQAMKKLPPNQKVLQRVLNARQFALKLIANVTYGYTAAGFSGRMPCAELADSIVQSGRHTLEKAINLVNSSPKWKAHVVYGDTDSMFVLLKGQTREGAFIIGQEIASAVTAMNPHPVTLKMEKVYHPCVLLTKKRYVGYSYETPTQSKPIFDAKGIETVRRDSCPVVSKMLERSLRILFETQDLSRVKHYLQRQWTKIISGRISLKDFIFAKEVRLGTYSSRASVLPPAAIVATKAMAIDPRAEPRYGERIPYIVVHGEPGSRLTDMVVNPHILINADSTLRLHDMYYITKQIIPAIQRAFGLVGVDLKQWYNEMPRPFRPSMTKRPVATAFSPLKGLMGCQKPDLENYKNQKGASYRWTIDHYYLSQHCIICGELIHSSSPICYDCSNNTIMVITALTGRASQLEREFQHLQEVCRHCMGTDGDIERGIACISLDCSVYFERKKVQKELQAAFVVANQCGYLLADPLKQ